jgi:DNA helicase-2/ATP-dependent DNA helicase PcrA
LPQTGVFNPFASVENQEQFDGSRAVYRRDWAYTIIDREDQVDLMRAVRGYGKSEGLPLAGDITNIYSLARNTRSNLSDAIARFNDEYLPFKEKIAPILRRYEDRKRQRRYLDYDDILDVVATQLRDDPQIRGVIATRYSHILVDEFQDTNNLQWTLLDNLKDHAKLFCVGDDAQSIYGFRGADFRTIHSFPSRVQGATVLKLEENYRSTQEILDLSNWLLEQSPLSYGKKLCAVRGAGKKPRLLNFVTEWDEAAWVLEDLLTRRAEGADWHHHMISVRAARDGRAIELHLIERKIPYIYIGGTALLQSAHIRDVLSVLRIVANTEDELAWVRYLRLWPGIGDVTANRIVEKILDRPNLQEILDTLAQDSKAGGPCRDTINIVAAGAANPAEAIRASVRALEPVLAKHYATDWDRRRRDFVLVEKLAEKHSTILGFIEEYLLDPIHGSQVTAPTEDAVTLITVHSAKGTEAKVCYVINVSPGVYPSSKSMDNKDNIEEERRVLYVALTRAKDELIITRRDYVTRAVNPSVLEEEQTAATAYFFNALPFDLVGEEIITPRGWQHNPKDSHVPPSGAMPKVGIIFDLDEQNAKPPLAEVIASPPAEPGSKKSTVDTSLAELWSKLLEGVGRANPFTRIYLLEAHPVSVQKNEFTIGFDAEFKDRLSRVDNARNHTLLQTKLRELGYPDMKIKCIVTA